MIEIFKAGTYGYPDKGFEKPVTYSEEMLKEIASKTDVINLTMGHDGEVIGQLKNFIFKDGGLYAEAPKGLDIKGFGISPTFDVDYVEGEEAYIPTNYKLIDAGLVENPRSGILYNSTEPTGDNNMADDKVLESLNKANDDLSKSRAENDRLKEQISELSKKTEKFDEVNKVVEEQNKKFEELNKQFETIKPKADKYSAFETKRKEELIKELTKDEETQKMLADEPMEKLEFYKNKNLFNTKPQGIGENQATGLDDGTQTPPPEDNTPEAKMKEYEAWKKANNVW